MSEFESANSGVTGTLTIFVHRAKELINVKKLDKQSPFVVLRVGHMTCRSKVCFRGGQKPEWSFVAKFQISPEIKPILEIDCFHETKNAPKFIGKSKVDFTTAIFANEDDGDDRWIELQNGVEYAGKIYLEMSFNLGSQNQNTVMGTDELGNSFTAAHSDAIFNLAGRSNDILDDIQSFTQSVGNREVPKFPSASTANENRNTNYQHGVVTSEPEINDFLNSKSVSPSNSSYSSYKLGTSQGSSQKQNYKQSHYSQQQYNQSPEAGSYNAKNNPYEAVPLSTDSSSSEPLFAKLRELKGKMFTFKHQQGNNGASHYDIGDQNINVGEDEMFHGNNNNRNFNIDNDIHGNNRLSNSKSSKNSQLSKEQMDFQILEKAIAGGVAFEQSVNNDTDRHFNINDDLPPLPSTKLVNNRYQMGERIDSNRTFSKSRVPSQPMKPIFDISRRPPPPMS